MILNPMRIAVPAAVSVLLISLFLLIPAAHASTGGTYHTLSVFVVDQNGNPLSGVRISITNSTVTNGTPVVTSYYKMTDSSGSASIMLSAANYSVSANLTGYIANRSYHIDLTGNATLRFEMIELSSNITGFITTLKLPVANATIELYNSNISYSTFSSSPLGAYRFDDVQAGAYNISVGKPGYFGNHTVIHLLPGKTVWINMTLTPRFGIVEGVVNITQNGRELPLQGALLTIQGSGLSYTMRSGKNGTYYFTNLTQGTYSVRVSMQGYFPGQAYVTVTEGRVTYLNFTLIPLSSAPPFSIPGFIGNLDLDHSLVIVTIIIVIFVCAGTLALLNRSYNWKEERKTR